jgi:hypothetical protein
MSAYRFTVLSVAAEPYAVAPQLTARLRIEETRGVAVHAMALRCQVRIEPQRRGYASDSLLRALFGPRERWAETVKPFLWMQANATVPSFRHSIETDLALPCTYDLDVIGSKYLHALEAGDVPLDFLFSGTVFLRGAASPAAATGSAISASAASPPPSASPSGASRSAASPPSAGSPSPAASSLSAGSAPSAAFPLATPFAVEQVPWECESRYAMPVTVWREMIDSYFPNSGWLRADAEIMKELAAYRARRDFISWDETLRALLDEAGS